MDEGRNVRERQIIQSEIGGMQSAILSTLTDSLLCATCTVGGS